MAERLDLIVFGATGFTGKYAVEEVNRAAKTCKPLTWGIAGRSQSKLDKIVKDLQNKTGEDLRHVKTFIADIKDEDSLKEMTRNARVIINCCGPYRFYGEAVVKACIDTKTSHVDVSGEPAFMETMQLKYNEAAKNAGVYIISACGFDSVPSDLGVIFLEQNFKGQLNSAEAYLSASLSPEVKRTGAGIHYGTWESLVHGISQQKELGPLRRQLFPEKLPTFSPKLKARPLIHKSDIVNGWCLPFPGSDKPVVYRSQRYLYETEKKRPVQMNAYVKFPSLFSALAVLSGVIFVGLMAMCSCGRSLLLKYPKFFSFGFISHEGPSEEVMNNTKFTMTVHGEGWDESVKNTDGVPTNKKMTIQVKGVNPGYGATCVALVYSAITILKESDKMPETGGVLAPGAAFAKTSFIETLNKNDVKFEVVN